MKTLLWLTAIAAFSLLTGSCTDNEIVGTNPLGTFQYTAYDTSGVAIVAGRLSLVFEDSSHVRGAWDFFPLIRTGLTGPQIGKGTLLGESSGGRLEINLNPGMIDNNVFLVGLIRAERYSGTWIYSGFAGILARGTFVAVR